MLGLGTLPAHAQEIMLNHRSVLGCCDWGFGFLTPKSRRILAKSCCTTAEQHILYNRSRTRPLLLSNIMTIVLTIVIYIYIYFFWHYHYHYCQCWYEYEYDYEY